MKRFFTLVFVLTSFYSFSQSLSINNPVSRKICAGATLKIPYVNWGGALSPGNILTVQLSSSTGSFSSPTVIGTKTTSLMSDSIPVTFPASLTASTSYYIRIVSSAPSTTSSSSNFTVGLPGTPTYIPSLLTYCNGNHIFLLSSGATTDESYRWTGPNGYTSTAQNPVLWNADTLQSGDYTVRLAWYGGCTGLSRVSNIKIYDKSIPPAPVVTTNYPTCTGDTLRLNASTVAGSTSYTWFKNTTYLSGNQNVQVNNIATASTDKYYAISTAANGCRSNSSDTLLVVVNTRPSVVGPVANGYYELMCAGQTLTLDYDNLGMQEYLWEGPNGFSGNGRTYNIANTTPQMSGVYTLKVRLNGCWSNPGSTNYIKINSLKPPSAQSPDWEWVQKVTGASYEYSEDIARDNADNLYVLGESYSTYTKFSPNDSLPAIGGSDIIVSKYRKEGTFVWSRRFGSNINDNASDIAIAPNGDLIITGLFGGPSISFGSVTLNRNGTTPNLFIARLDSLGNPLWAKQAYTAGGFISGGSFKVPVATDHAGNVFVSCGYTGSGCTIEGITLTGMNVFFAKFQPDGTILWAKKVNSYSGNYDAVSIVCDNADNIYLHGDFNSWESSLNKYDNNGTQLWSKSYSNKRASGVILMPSNERGGDLILDHDKGLYMVATYWNYVKPSTLAVNPNYYMVLMRLDFDGNVKWHQYINELIDGYSHPYLGVDQKSNVYINSMMNSGDNDLGCSGISLAGGKSFIMEFDSTGAIKWAQPNNTYSARMTVNPEGECYMASLYSNINSNLGSFKLPNNSNGDIVLSKLGKLIHSTVFPSQSYCVGNTFKVGFTSEKNYTTGNVFTVQLSDSTGSFASPVSIGTLASLTPDSITCQIPYDAYKGSKYRIRIVSSSPAYIGNNNGSDLIIKRPVLSTNFNLTNLCPGSFVKVPFTVTGGCGFYSGNVYTAELSDNKGTFSYPILLGSLTSTSMADTILAFVPDTISYSTLYKIRITASNPSQIGTVSTSSITILGKPVITIAGGYFCAGTPLNLSTPTVTGATYAWQGPNSFTSTTQNPVIASLTPLQAGQYKLTITKGACISPQSVLSVPYYSANTLDSLNWHWAKGILPKYTTAAYVRYTTDLKTDFEGNVFTYGWTYNALDTVGNTPIVKGLFLMKSDRMGNVLWVRNMPVQGDSYNNSKKMIVDNDGNVYLNGILKGTITIGSTVLNSGTAIETFLAKYAPDGSPQWAYKIGAQLPGNLAVDSDGNIHFVNSLALANGQSLSINHKNGVKVYEAKPSTQGLYLLLKYAPDGSLLKSLTFKRSDDNLPTDGSLNISVATSSNRVYISGAFGNSVTIDDVVLTNYYYPGTGTSHPDVFIAALDNDFNIIWGRTLGSGQNEYTYALSADAYGNTYIAMNTNGANTFAKTTGNNYLSFTGDGDYLVKYSKDGDFQWARNIDYEDISAIDTDENGNTYISTRSNTSTGNSGVRAGCTLYTSPSGTVSSWLLKVNTAGEFKMAKWIGSAYLSGSNAVKADALCYSKADGSVYTSGYFINELRLDTMKLVSGYNYNLFLAKLIGNDSIPAASFKQDKVCKADTTTFTDLSSTLRGTITNWQWNFGDPASGAENSSVLTSPKHVFSNSGSFTVKLKVTNDLGKSDSITKVVTIAPLPAVPVLTQTVDTLYASYVSGNSYKWYLNGTLISNTYPQFIPGADGLYKATATNASGCNAQSPEFNYTLPVHLNAAFSFAPATSICEGEVLTFTDLSTVNKGTIDRLHWDFGTIALDDSSVVANPGFTYSAAGSYTVRLIAYGSLGTRDTIRKNITVLAKPTVPVVTINVDTLTTATGMTSYLWKADNVVLSGFTTNRITIPADGEYSVTVTNSGGCSATSLSYPLIKSTPVTSLAEMLGSYGLTVFPNPAISELTIHFERNPEIPLQYELIDAIGNEVLHGKTTGFNTLLSLNGISQGIYLLKIERNGENSYYKVVKQ